MTASGVPYFPLTFPPGTVFGRLGLTPGPGEAITFADLFGNLTTVVPRIITTGNPTIAATDGIIILNKAVAATTLITLPSAAGRDGIPLAVYDWANNAGVITFIPDGTELINGATSWAVASGSFVRLIPFTSGTLVGWVAEPVENSGVSLLDFGAAPGIVDANIAVVGQPGIRADSVVEAWVMPKATTDHTLDEHWVDPPFVYAGNVTAGLGFTIYGRTSNVAIYGKWNVRWRWTH